MGKRSDKGNAIARFILGNTGMPGVSWNQDVLSCPAPYSMSTTTGLTVAHWTDRIRVEHQRMHIAIRYNYSMDSVANAWVGMQLHQFVPILKAHYDTTWKGTGDAS